MRAYLLTMVIGLGLAAAVAHVAVKEIEGATARAQAAFDYEHRR